MTTQLRVVPGRTREPRVISIASGKGGVGKTHTALNLALALRHKGKRVLVLDADFGLANFNIMLGVSPAFTIQDYVDGVVSLEEVVFEVAPGFSFIPGCSGVLSVVNMSWERRRSLQLELEQVAKGYDYVIIDTPAGIGEDTLFLSAAASEVLVVVTPEPTSLTDAYALMKVVCQKYHERDFSILVNCAPRNLNPDEARTTFERIAAVCGNFLKIKLNYLGYIPCDPLISECILSRVPTFSRYPNGRAGRAILRLANRLENSKPTKGISGGVQFFFEKLIESGVS